MAHLVLARVATSTRGGVGVIPLYFFLGRTLEYADQKGGMLNNQICIMCYMYDAQVKREGQGDMPFLAIEGTTQRRCDKITCAYVLM